MSGPKFCWKNNQNSGEWNRMTLPASGLVALLLVLVAVFVQKRAARQALLLGASYVFYQVWGFPFLAVLIASSVGNFYLGAWLAKRPHIARLWVGILFNVFLLGFFKYLPALPGISETIHRLVMPVGMSFWTFQAMSYLFDVYHEVEMDPSLLEFCLYMAFWPTVFMGPVCRLPKMLPQFRSALHLSFPKFKAGIQRVGEGLFMKLILAQLLGSALTGFDDAGRAWGGLDVWAMALGFGFQLFFDFAGYSNIVIGAASIFGFELEENFDSPFLSLTPSAYWTRWHMSLSSWIRDYVFIPVAALWRAPWWRYASLIVSMTLFGLWHGAKITFVVWGVYQGVFLVLHRFWQQLQRRFEINFNGGISDFGAWLLTFGGITLSWILFRAKDMHEAFVMYGAILSPSTYGKLDLPRNFYGLLITLAVGYFVWNLVLDSQSFHKIRNYLQGPDDDPTFLQVCWQKRWWGLAPMITIFVIFAGLMVMFQSAGVTPFIYAGF